MRRRLTVISLVAALAAACTPQPPASEPTQPVISSFYASPASGTAPLTTALRWSVSDANHDQLSCSLDADGDGTFEIAIPACDSTTIRTANFLSAGVRTLTLEVSDANTPPVQKTLIVAATAPSADTFNITLRLDPAMSPARQAIFNAAAARWSQIIRTGLPDVALTLAAGECDTDIPEFSGTVDDLLIDASIVPIDGPSGILGSAGPCFIRTGNQLPIYGTMRFDIDDVEQLETDGELYPVILHEMGHVLGFGTVWSTMGLLFGAGGYFPSFTGNAAGGEWQQLGGTSFVPVEGLPSPAGTADSHWRESTFDNELMTGYISGADNPLSRLTAASLADLGYGVDLSAADPYSPPAPLTARRRAARPVPPVTLLLPRHSL